MVRKKRKRLITKWQSHKHACAKQMRCSSLGESRGLLSQKIKKKERVKSVPSVAFWELNLRMKRQSHIVTSYPLYKIYVFIYRKRKNTCGVFYCLFGFVFLFVFCLFFSPKSGLAMAGVAVRGATSLNTFCNILKMLNYCSLCAEIPVCTS